MKEIDQGTFGRIEQVAMAIDLDIVANTVPPGWIHYDEDGVPREFKEFPPNDFQIFYEGI